MIEIKRKSYLTGNFNVRMINATAEQMRLYEVGMSIEDSMPNLDPADAAFVASGITDDEWKMEMKRVKETT